MLAIYSVSLLLLGAAAAAPAAAAAGGDGGLVGGVADVTKFGAKGDGTTSDYAAVKAAAAAVEKAGGGTLLFPVKSGALAAAAAAPCPPSPRPGHANKTFCSSDPASGQCSSPPRKNPCPPCANANAGMKTGYVTGA